MSEDETVALVASVALSCITWIRWGYCWASTRSLRPASAGVGWLGVSLIASLVSLWAVLHEFASFDVTDSPLYQGFYLLMGVAWIGVFAGGFAVCNLIPRDDVFVRGNRSAAYATAGALYALMLCFAGGNIGDGPGWWVVAACGFLSTLGLYVVWLLYASFTGVMHSITVVRDLASGIRLAGLLVGAGLILGCSVAGDWRGWNEVVISFGRRSWPCLILLAFATMTDWLLKPTANNPERSVITCGMSVFVADMVMAVSFMEGIGWWPGVKW